MQFDRHCTRYTSHSHFASIRVNICNPRLSTHSRQSRNYHLFHEFNKFVLTSLIRILRVHITSSKECEQCILYLLVKKFQDFTMSERYWILLGAVTSEQKKNPKWIRFSGLSLIFDINSVKSITNTFKILNTQECVILEKRK